MFARCYPPVSSLSAAIPYAASRRNAVPGSVAFLNWADVVSCEGARYLVKGRAWPDTEEVTGSNPVAPTNKNHRSERRPSSIGGALVVPRVAWGHTGATAGPPRQPNDRARGRWLDGAVERVQAVAERAVGLRVEVAVAVQGEAHRGVPSPRRDLLRVGAGRDPQRHRRVPKGVDAQPAQPPRHDGWPPHPS